MACTPGFLGRCWASESSCGCLNFHFFCRFTATLAWGGGRLRLDLPSAAAVFVVDDDGVDVVVVLVVANEEVLSGVGWKTEGGGSACRLGRGTWCSRNTRDGSVLGGPGESLTHPSAREGSTVLIEGKGRDKDLQDVVLLFLKIKRMKLETKENEACKEKDCRKIIIMRKPVPSPDLSFVWLPFFRCKTPSQSSSV